jgi:hypothetical protein
VAVDERDEVRGGVVRKVYHLGGEAVAVREGPVSAYRVAQGESVAGATRYLP